MQLSDDLAAPALVDFLQTHGFLVIWQSPTELRVHLLNHVSDRFDRVAAQAALAAWCEIRPDPAAQDAG